MPDGIKRLLSKSKSHRPADASGSGERPPIPRVPSFKETRYEDAVQGARPIVGLLPLRGNRMFAVRHESPKSAPDSVFAVSSAGHNQIRPKSKSTRIQRHSRGPPPSHRYRDSTNDSVTRETTPSGASTPDSPSLARDRPERSSLKKRQPGIRRRAKTVSFHSSTEERELKTEDVESAPESDFDSSGILADHSEGQVGLHQLPAVDQSPFDIQDETPLSPASAASWTTADDGRTTRQDGEYPFGAPNAVALATTTGNTVGQERALSSSDRDSAISIDSHSSRLPLDHSFVQDDKRPAQPDIDALDRSFSEASLQSAPASKTTTAIQPIAPPPRGSSKGKTQNSVTPRETLNPPSLAPEEVLRRANYNSKHTTVYETIKPAITHETIVEKIHHVREECIQREIHNYDIYHRILPIIDVEVLPAVHFRVENGELVEMRPEEVPSPGRNGDHAWLVGEAVSKEAPKGSFVSCAFPAREPPSEASGQRRYVTPEGVLRTETMWIHPRRYGNGPDVNA